MKSLILMCVGVTFLAGLLSIFVFHIPVALVATVALGAVCLAWLVLMVTLPWNLYFEARHVLTEMARCRERGINIPEAREQETTRMQRRALRVSVGLHVLSAGGMAAVALISNVEWAWWFSGFYLLSSVFRPGVEYHRYLRARLSTILQEVNYPRNDVMALVMDVERLKQRADEHEREYRELFTHVQALEQQTTQRDNENERKVVAVSRKFEETVDRLTDNQEIISGIKAFLRLVTEPRAPQ